MADHRPDPPALESVPAPPAPHAGGGRRTLLLIAAVAAAPIVVAAIIFFFFPQAAQTNYGRLLPVGPAPAIAGTLAGGAPFRLDDLRGKWVLLTAAPGRCDAPCRKALYATRQARTIQGREYDRVVRLWLVTDGDAPPPDLLRDHPDIVAARVEPASVGSLPGAGKAIVLVDPLGNLVLEYPEDPDIARLAKDLKRLLRASSIG
ncbi:MAG: hypothetical protein ABI920_05585 [Casimicrobiaceae bacterium]